LNENLQGHGSASTEGLSKEELGRLVASRWTGEKSAEKDENPKDGSQKEHNNDLAEPAEEEENYDSYNSEMEDDRYRNDEDEHKSDDEYDNSDEEYGDDHADTAYVTDTYKSDDEYKSDNSGYIFIVECIAFFGNFPIANCSLQMTPNILLICKSFNELLAIFSSTVQLMSVRPYSEVQL
jgi:hypothetical protein